MSKVAYILGAGASYGERILRQFEKKPEYDERGNVLYDITRGLPVMNEMKDAVDQLLNDIEDEKRYSVCPPQQMLKNLLLELHNACAKYPTVDTYAQILYANEEYEAYYNLKAQLSIAFMLWQKLEKYDQRYISFLNSLINPTTRQLPNLTILSWNYDVQLEMAYDNYMKDWHALVKTWDDLNVFCKTYPVSKIPNVQKYDEKLPFAFIKMNGSALFFNNDRDDRTLRFTIQDPFWNIQDKKEKYDLLYEIYTNRETGTNPFEHSKYVNGLSYAWEAAKQPEVKKRITERVENTEVVVIIGYSFPEVNKEIDRHIFECMPALKKIYIQDNNAIYIEEQVKKIFDYLNRPVPFMETKDVRNFYIPNELG